MSWLEEPLWPRVTSAAGLPGIAQTERDCRGTLDRTLSRLGVMLASRGWCHASPCQDTKLRGGRLHDRTVRLPLPVFVRAGRVAHSSTTKGP